MIKTKIYLYDRTKEDFKGIDYSQYILLGENETNDLTEELDTREITLSGLSLKEAFEPTTKFIMEVWEDDTLVETQNWVVQQDLVEKPILAEEYYKHNMSLIEPSVIAQQRTCDNFSISYKLQDISLEQKASIDTTLDTFSQKDSASTENIQAKNSYKYNAGLPETVTINCNDRVDYKWEYANDTEKQKWEDFKRWQQVGTQVALTLPLLRVSSKIKGSTRTSKLGYASVDFIVKKETKTTTYYLNANNQWQTEKVVRRVDPATSSEGEWVQQPILPTGIDENNVIQTNGISKGWILNGVVIDNQKEDDYSHNVLVYYLKQVAHYIETPINRNISFTIETGCKYSIEGFLHNFETPEDNINIWKWNKGDRFTSLSWNGESAVIGNNFAITYLEKVIDNYVYIKYDNTNLPINSFITQATLTVARTDGSLLKTIIYSEVKIDSISLVYTNQAQPKVEVNCYAYTQDTSNYFITSAPPASAYDLLMKSILVTQNLYKGNESWNDFVKKLAFYTSDEDIELLKSTQVIEAEYKEKNLWEMLIEIGKYIHAIPRIIFGEDDKFLIKWDKLGMTEQLLDTATPISIFNSKKLEEYISACDSYITNMVQLGGQIEEWVVPKSSSDDYLVYNDVAEIKVSKPILEIVSMKVQCLSTAYGESLYHQTRSLTGTTNYNEGAYGYVFESSIYQLLSIQATTNVNKGLAIYYDLGDNVIKGLNYQLPTENAGDPENDYSIKRILGTVFGMAQSSWKNIKVNDFAFDIVYRTKDSLRQVQTRPDLRKYMLNSIYDRIPIHKQFNNQTDVVLDSVKFGNNIYGKLIKTGNLGYTMTEWCSTWGDVKKVGYLYNINGNIYYLSKITKTYLGTQIMCQLEFSKDYNQLSAIIGIPSEPRFYEIAERNIINREVSFDDYLMVGTDDTTTTPIVYKYMSAIYQALFSNIYRYPNYMVCCVKNIQDRPIESDTAVDSNKFHKEFMLPLSTYSCKNTITFECDTIDNFSAGDQVGDEREAPDSEKYDPTNNAYRELKPYQYCDSMGRGDLFEFAVIDYNMNNNDSGIRNLPALPFSQGGVYLYDIIASTDNLKNYISSRGTIDNKTGLILMKDSREAISFNYNLQMLTDSDRFVLSGYLWQLQKGSCGLVLLNTEINKLSNDTIPTQHIIGWSYGGFNDYAIPLREQISSNLITLKIREMLESKYTDEQIAQAKAIAIVSNNVLRYDNSQEYFVMGRNISDLSVDEKKQNWYIKEYDVSQARENTDLPN